MHPLDLINEYYGIVIAAGVLIAIFYLSFRNGSNNTLSSTINDYKAAIEIRDVTIRDMKASHQAQLDSQQKQIESLQQQIKALQEQNKTLQETVTGRDILTKLQENLSRFEFIIPKIDHFEENDQIIIDMLKVIQTLLAVKVKHVSTQKS